MVVVTIHGAAAASLGFWGYLYILGTGTQHRGVPSPVSPMALLEPGLGLVLSCLWGPEGPRPQQQGTAEKEGRCAPQSH